MLRFLGSTFAVCFLVLVFSPARAEDAQDPKAIIEKAVEAVGGADKQAKLGAHTWKEKGTFYGMGAGLPYAGNYAVQLPDKFRMEIENVFTIVVNGDKGWINTQGDTQDIPKEQMAGQKLERYNRRVTTLLPLMKDKGFELASLGESKINDKSVVGVKVSHKNHKDVKLFFDKETHLLTKAEYISRDDQAGEDVKQEVWYKDYKDVDGLKVASKMVIKRDGKDFIEAEEFDIKFADKLDDKMFSKP